MKSENGNRNKNKTQVESEMDREQAKVDSIGTVTWGPWLFRLVALLSAVFVWWLVIYDHGVVSAH